MTYSQALPLIVDLDGTLTPADTLVESIVVLLRRGPFWWVRLFFWLFLGRCEFKRRVSDNVALPVALLPWRQEVLAWLKQERASGRRLVLATAADERIATAVAAQLQLFDAVLATGHGVNLKGRYKLAAIQQQVGMDFVYAGDSHADLPIWEAARSAVLVGVSKGVQERVRAQCAVEREFPRAPAGPRVWLRAMRVHQWVKNLLIFVPLLTSFQLAGTSGLIDAVLAFTAFSLTASGSYLLNDLWDLEADRQHARKRHRPFASAVLSPLHGLAMAGVLIAVGLVLASGVSLTFLAMVVGYLALTTGYSWSLKRYVMLDVLTLSLLYTYRVLAGAVVIAVPVTTWLLAFAVFLFTSLALVKRCAELVTLQQAGKARTNGRDYVVSDLAVLWPMGVGCSLSAVVVFGLYLGSSQAQSIYGNSPALWLVGVGLLYWMSRLWIKTGRGEMHDDPIVFALRDRGSLITIVMIVAWVVAVRVFH